MSKGRINIRQAEMKKARIEIIPMIDTIFFLLVFFLITSITQTKMNGMATSLPKDSTAASKPPAKAVITDDAAGNLYINTDKVAMAQIQPQLQDMINQDPTTILIVNVDKTRKVQEAISIMDAVNKVNLPPAVVTPDNTSPAVMIATTPVDASGNAATSATATTSAAPAAGGG